MLRTKNGATMMVTEETPKKTQDADTEINEAGIAVLIFLFTLFGLITLSYLLGIPLFSSSNGTSLTPSEILVVAGLTITYYSLFDQLIVKRIRREIIHKTVRTLILILTMFNIFYLSICIVFVLISTVSSIIFKNIGFNILLSSWITNIAIIITLFLSSIIPSLAKRGTIRDIIIIAMGIAILIMIPYAIWHPKLF